MSAHLFRDALVVWVLWRLGHRRHPERVSGVVLFVIGYLVGGGRVARWRRRR